MLVVLQRLDFFINVFRGDVDDRSVVGAAFDVQVRPDVLHQHPLFGFGLNSFSVYFEFVTGRANWGRTRTTWR